MFVRIALRQALISYQDDHMFCCWQDRAEDMRKLRKAFDAADVARPARTPFRAMW